MTIATAWKRLRDGLLGRRQDERDERAAAIASELAVLRAVKVVHSYRESELRKTMRETFSGDITDTLELLGGYPREKPRSQPDNDDPKSGR